MLTPGVLILSVLCFVQTTIIKRYEHDTSTAAYTHSFWHPLAPAEISENMWWPSTEYGLLAIEL